MITIGAIIFSLALFVHVIFVGDTPTRIEPTIDEVNARWENVA